ncbi:MAG: radical SAM protein [Candidatus Omnitrophica bacterium]|nr:radical SAM protein [Candidatus Omnitrophota bacterium]
MNRHKEKPVVIGKGALEVHLYGNSLKFYWQGKELTANCGFNIAVNTAGMWADSSYSQWEVLEKGETYVILNNIWHQLPVSCTWRLEITENYQILWDVHMEVEEILEIDERRAIIIVSSSYKSWVNSFEEGRFPPIIGWQNMPFDNLSSKLVGTRFSQDPCMVPFVLEFDDNQYGRIFPLIQNTSSDIEAHVIGAKMIDYHDRRCFAKGRYKFFSGTVSFLKNEPELDQKIENLKTSFFEREQRTSKLANKKGVKVLLVNFPWQNEKKWGVRAGSRWPHIKDKSEGNYLPFPFFLAYATALLRKNGIEADLIDAIASQIPEESFIEELSKRDFDVLVAETSVPSFNYDIELLRKISSLDFPIVLCGPHPEIYRPQFLEKNSFIDFVLFAEYEFTLLQLIEDIAKGGKSFSSIPGLIWRDSKNSIIKNPPRPPFDINLLPWPYRDNLAMERYWDLPGNIPHPSIQMVASRGCPFGCDFCLWPQLLFGGRKYRTRDVGDCIDEMEYMVRKRNFKSVYWDDDTFNIGKGRMLKFSEEIIRRGLNRIPWAIMAKADLMDEEILNAFKKAGLHAVKYGVESASQELVDRCGKGLDLKKAERMINYTKSLDIGVHLTFTFGLRGETKDTMKRTIDYALYLDPHSIQFSIMTPFPGTRLFEELDDEGKIITKNWSFYDGHYNCVFKPDNVSGSELEEAKRYAYRLWAEHKRKKRGFSGDVERFLNYCRDSGFKTACGKAKSYLNYVIFHRSKFIGKI